VCRSQIMTSKMLHIMFGSGSMYCIVPNLPIFHCNEYGSTHKSFGLSYGFAQPV
jgi:hypothetical protein